MGGEAWVLDLRDSKACDSTQTGAKAANLAIAGTAGLPVLDGIVLTVEGVQGLQRPGCTRVLATLRSTARRFEDASLVVRSSSTVEDAETGSMAGQFTSILDVRGWDALREAVGEGDDVGPHRDGEGSAARGVDPADARCRVRRCALRRRSGDGP